MFNRLQGFRTTESNTPLVLSKLSTG